MIIIWVAVIVGLVYFMRHLSRMSAGRQNAGETPVDILKKRYARGEITKIDYDRMKEDLKD